MPGASRARNSGMAVGHPARGRGLPRVPASRTIVGNNNDIEFPMDHAHVHLPLPAAPAEGVVARVAGIAVTASGFRVSTDAFPTCRGKLR